MMERKPVQEGDNSMKTWTKVLLAGAAVGAVGVIAAAAYQQGKKQALAQQNRRRRRRAAIPCTFPPELSEEEFERMAIRAAHRLKKKKVLVWVRNATIFGRVDSQSGLSQWKFSADFNDHGRITGEYRIWSENEDSLIPRRVAESVREALLAMPE